MPIYRSVAFTMAGRSFQNSIAAFDAFDKPFDAFDNSFDAFDNSFGVFDKSFDAFDNSFGVFDKSFGTFDKSFDTFDKSFGAFDKLFGAFDKSFGTFIDNRASMVHSINRVRSITFDHDIIARMNPDLAMELADHADHANFNQLHPL